MRRDLGGFGVGFSMKAVKFLCSGMLNNIFISGEWARSVSDISELFQMVSRARQRWKHEDTNTFRDRKAG